MHVQCMLIPSHQNFHHRQQQQQPLTQLARANNCRERQQVVRHFRNNMNCENRAVGGKTGQAQRGINKNPREKKAKQSDLAGTGSTAVAFACQKASPPSPPFEPSFPTIVWQKPWDTAALCAPKFGTPSHNAVCQSHVGHYKKGERPHVGLHQRTLKR